MSKRGWESRRDRYLARAGERYLTMLAWALAIAIIAALTR